MAKREQADDESWLDHEIAGSEFQDVRLRKRFAMLLERLWKGMGQTIPLTCQDCANTTAAYRFMDNDRVSEHDILSGHFQATAQRFSTTDGPILVLQVHHHVFIRKGTSGTHRLCWQRNNFRRATWPHEAEPAMRHPDALKSRRHN
jgi:hypothetical protein